MKRFLGALGLFLSAAFASGCPVYSDTVIYSECFYATDCPLGHRCSGGVCVPGPPHGGPSDDGGVTDGGSEGDVSADGSGGDSVSEGGASDAVPPDSPEADARSAVDCGNPNDCAVGETCSSDGTCRSGSCPTIACINQYQCANTSAGAACVRGDSQGCGSDRDCLSAARCIDGVCAPLADLCNDRSQCGADSVCADGRCTKTCTADTQCSTGFLCRAALGICGTKAKSCVRTSECGSKDEVCVDGGCLPRCSVAGACGTGNNVCVDNGCAPSTKIAVECDPTKGLACAGGRVCVHRHCYVACDQDAGGGCDPQSSTPVCRVMNEGDQMFAICVATGAFGSECDPTTGKVCDAGKTCIDGVCK